jgi:hypothetical protein
MKHVRHYSATAWCITAGPDQGTRMIPKECKRLAEVPIAVVSKHSAREKSIRHDHPSTLHLWWPRGLIERVTSKLGGPARGNLY